MHIEKIWIAKGNQSESFLKLEQNFLILVKLLGYVRLKFFRIKNFKIHKRGLHIINFKT